MAKWASQTNQRHLQLQEALHLAVHSAHRRLPGVCGPAPLVLLVRRRQGRPWAPRLPLPLSEVPPVPHCHPHPLWLTWLHDRLPLQRLLPAATRRPILARRRLHPWALRPKAAPWLNPWAPLLPQLPFTLSQRLEVLTQGV